MSRDKPGREAKPTVLGILDWGIGGIDFFARFRAARPDVPVVYLSDTGVTPYGKMHRATLVARLARVLAFFAEHGATEVVVACNAASTAVDAPEVARVARENGILRVTGVIRPTLASVRLAPGSRVGIVGGRRTILSRAYATPLRARGLEVLARIAQPLSAMVERGELDGPRVRAEVARVVAPLPRLDALVLACTHYIALAPLFRAHCTCPFVDPTAATLAHVTRGLGAHAQARASSEVWTTGDAAAMGRAAEAAFGVELPRVRRAKV